MVPCGVQVDPSLSYRVSGAGISPSYSFVLPKGREHVTVRTQTGSAGRSHWGSALTLTGAGLLLVGALGLATAARTGAFKNTQPGDSAHTGLVVGITTVVIGGVLLLVGVPVAWGSGTDVQVSRSTRSTVALTPSGLAF